MPMDTLKCGGCGKNRAQSRFSRNQISKYEISKRRADRIRDQSIVIFPRCSDCSGAPAQELRCSQCDVVKDLSEFSKQMRRNPDHALCITCSTDRTDLEPEHRDQVQEEITMDRIRMGATSASLGLGSTAFGHTANSRAMGYSNGLSASTNVDGTSDWIQPPIPVPSDPRARPTSGSAGTRSPSVVSNNTFASNASAITGTEWDNYAPNPAVYHTNMRRSSNSSGSRGGNNPGFARQGAVRPDSVVKAHNALVRQQLRESEQAEQAASRDSDDEDDDDNDSDDAY